MVDAFMDNYIDVVKVVRNDREPAARNGSLKEEAASQRHEEGERRFQRIRLLLPKIANVILMSVALDSSKPLAT